MFVMMMDCIDLGASSECGRSEVSTRTKNDWIGAAFLSSTGAEAL